MNKIVSLFLIVVCANAVTISALFKKINQSPVLKLKENEIVLSSLNKEKILDKLSPTFRAFATYEYYNSYTNLRPLPPTEANSLIRSSSPLPFGKDIQRIGISVNMPIFVKEIDTLRRKLDFVIKAKKQQKKLAMIENEAEILGNYAALIAFKKYKEALEKRKSSLLKTCKYIKLKVKNGKAAEISLFLIENKIFSLDAKLEKLKIKEALAKSNIEKITGIKVDALCGLKKVGDLKKDNFFILKILENITQANRLEIEAKKETFLPKISFFSRWSKNYTKKDVLLNQNTNKEYGNIGIKVNFVFSKENFTDIQIAKINYLGNNYKIKKVGLELLAKEKLLKENLLSYKKICKLLLSKIKKEEKLLKYAKVAFRIGKINEEEYLRYEDSVLETYAHLYEIEAKRWQALAALAVLYGIELERIVK
jgi:hypothetical protein